MRYFDRDGTEIKAGMFLHMEDGSIEQVYSCGENDLGINDSNEDYLRRHEMDNDFYRECYPLSEFNLGKVQICQLEQIQEEQGLSM